MSKDIRNGAKRVVIGLACFALAAAARAEAGAFKQEKNFRDNPCVTITNRNIFGLRYDQGEIQNPPKIQLTNVKLEGITTILGKKQALLLVNEPAVEGKTSIGHIVVLCERQRFGGVEVIEINPESRSVKVRKESSDFMLGFSAKETGK